MAKTIIFAKLRVSTLDHGEIDVAVPKFEKDREVFNKLYGDFKASVSKPRNLEFHQKFFAIANLCVENGMIEMYLTGRCIVKDEERLLRPEIIQRLFLKYKSETYLLIYLAKWLFLPLEEEILPNGETVSKVSSISFEEMDNLVFTDFFNATVDYWAKKLGTTADKLLSYSET